MKIEIKDRLNREVIFSIECESVLKCLEKAILEDSDLSGANLSGADLSGAKLSGAYLPGADLPGADLSDANLSDANLPRADLSEANLSRADLSEANLSGAKLSGAKLSEANLSGANLSGANLSRADLSGAKLSETNLSDANLPRADLSGAKLSGANLSRANLSGAKGVNPFRCTPLLILLDQPKENDLIAYKLTSKLYHSPIAPAHGYMAIQYVIGVTTEELDADDNADEQCAKGISVATLDWCMREWREGYKILRGTFKVSDIACIPTSTDGKFRLRRFTPINEVDLKEIGLEQE